ncbi:MAG: ABC transporter permease [Acidobacteriia bacterium]|nr:ABC transporter permease [Terriglobia bacterium]
MSELWRRLLVLFRRDRFDREIEEEMQFHLEMQAEENQENGMPADDAGCAARRQFGNPTLLKETSREIWGWGWRERLGQDLIYAFRMMRKNPGVTTVAVVALTLGIGANAAIFSLVNAIYLRPLPYREPDRIVTVLAEESSWLLRMAGRAGRLTEQWSHNHIPGPAFLALKNEIRSFAETAAWEGFQRKYVLAGGDNPREVAGVRVSANLFPMLGVQPILGRGFLEEEDRVGGSRVILMGHSLWQDAFGGDPSMIGKALILNGESYTVVGVMPPGPRTPEADIWVPLALGTIPGEFGMGMWNFQAVARLAPGATRGGAQEEVNAFVGRMLKQYPDANQSRRLFLLPLRDFVVGDRARPVLVLLGAVSFVLLIACANVANLMLMRFATRRRELALRVALGAGRLRIVRQLLAESTLLWILGAIAGLLIAYWGIDLFRSMVPVDIPRREEVGIDWRVLTFTGLLSFLSAILFGLIPALPASRIDLNAQLKEGAGPRSAGTGRQTLRGVLVAGEVALAFILLVGAGLMIHTFARLWAVQPGFAPERLLTMRISQPRHKYGDPGRQAAFFQELLQRVEALPGVLGAAAADTIPFGKAAQNLGFSTEKARAMTSYRLVTPDYFRTMGIPLLKGRLFDEHDRAPDGAWMSEQGLGGAPGVVIINEMMARRCWPNENPIGKRMNFSNAGGRPARLVVGVVGAALHQGLDQKIGLEVYVPYYQRPGAITMFVAVRTRDDAQSAAATLRAQVHALDKDQPVEDVRTMEQLMQDSVAPRWFLMLLLSFFGAVSLALAAVGIYGVMAYAVTQRTQEIGIRMALGAQRGDVFRLVGRQGLVLTAAGMALGLAGALALTRVITTMLFGVTPRDAVAFALATLGLGTVALVASCVPAWRATRVDPIAALRCE